MKKFKTWDELTELEQLETAYCEMHKDVYGVKARWYWTESVEQARRDVESLQQALERAERYERVVQQVAVAKFEELVRLYGFEQAKRWQHDACGTTGDDERLCWELGLPLNYFATRQQG